MFHNAQPGYDMPMMSKMCLLFINERGHTGLALASTRTGICNDVRKKSMAATQPVWKLGRIYKPVMNFNDQM